MKLLVIYNFAQKYRTGIFREIDKTWDCKWIFGHTQTDIKEMDTSFLKNVKFVENKKCIGPFKRQSEIVKEAIKGDFDTLLMLGEPFNLSTWAIMLRNICSRHQKKVYLWSHGWYGREGFVKKWFKRAFFGLADKIFLYGNYAKQVAIGQGFDENKLEVIHNSLDHDHQIKLRATLKPSEIYRNHFGNDHPVIIFIGRLTEVKRLDMLVEAVAVLKRRQKKFNVVFIGDGEKRGDLEDLVRQKDLTSQFWFYGSCYDDAQNAQLIYDADLCVAPGNVGLTAMHTMVFGTPVLTHNCFPMQMPEFEAIIQGKTGAFFLYDDIKSLADEIEVWTDNSTGRREQIRQNCYAEIDSSWTPAYQIATLKKVIK